MKRREFFERTLLGGAVVRAGSSTQEARAAVAQVVDSRPAEMFREGERVIERPMAGRPHAGKVLAAIQPHSDDIPLFAGGTVAKLISEGYSGCLIRMTNDEKAGRGATTGEMVLNNERDNDAVAKALGLTKVFNFNYRNHRMDNESRQEIRGRLIHLFRHFRWTPSSATTRGDTTKRIRTTTSRRRWLNPLAGWRDRAGTTSNTWRRG
jgi:GlcNAc-PI de-N-acetylase